MAEAALLEAVRLPEPEGNLLLAAVAGQRSTTTLAPKPLTSVSATSRMLMPRWLLP